MYFAGDWSGSGRNGRVVSLVGGPEEGKYADGYQVRHVRLG
jgi:hypothetical protein